MADSPKMPDVGTPDGPQALTEATDLQTLLSAILGEPSAQPSDAAGQIVSPTPLPADSIPGAATPALPVAVEPASTAPAMSTSREPQDSNTESVGPVESDLRAERDERPVAPNAPIPFVPRKNKRQARQGRPASQNGVWKTTGRIEPAVSAPTPNRAVPSATGRLAVARSAQVVSTPSVAPAADVRPTAEPPVRAPFGSAEPAETELAESVALWRRPPVVAGVLGVALVAAWLGLRSAPAPAPGSVTSPTVPSGAVASNAPTAKVPAPEPSPALADARPESGPPTPDASSQAQSARTTTSTSAPTAAPRDALTPAVAPRTERQVRSERGSRNATAPRRGAASATRRDTGASTRESAAAAAAGPNLSPANSSAPASVASAATETVPAPVQQQPSAVSTPAVAPAPTTVPAPTAVAAPREPAPAPEQAASAASNAVAPAPTVAAPPLSRPVRVVSRAQPVTRGAGAAEVTSGVVNVRVTVDATGKVTSVRSVSGPTALRDIAEDAARRSRFEPALQGGTPAGGDVTISYSFARPANDVRRRVR